MNEELNLELLPLLDGGENNGLSSLATDALAKHSGRYVRERNPKLYQAICLLIKWGVAFETIATELSVSRNLVSAIGHEVSLVSLEHHKEEILAGLRRFGRGAIRMMVEAVEGGEKIPVGTLALAFGITTDKEQLLTGGVTSRTQVIEDPETAAFMRLLSGLRQAPPQMGLEGENLPATGAGLPDPGRVIEMTLETAPEHSLCPESKPATQANAHTKQDDT